MIYFMKLGSVSQKVLLLLLAGVALSLTKRPDQYFRILNKTQKEWKKINQRSLHKTIKLLHKSNFIDYKQDSGGVEINISTAGQKRILFSCLNGLKINKPKVWDKLWRVVMFDIPEDKKNARDALAQRLKNLGFYKLQKSVFIHPYDCKNEINILLENFEVKQFIRFLLVQQTDIDSELRTEFHL